MVGGHAAGAEPLTESARVGAFSTLGAQLGICLVPYLVLVFLTSNWIEEDAFIYFRVAQNIAAGYGYVFNAGGAVIETGSSLAWQLLLVPLAGLPLPLESSAKGLGVLFGCAAQTALLLLARRHLRSPAAVCAAPLLMAVSIPFLMWGQSGLETPLHLFVAIWFVLWVAEAPDGTRWVAPACLLLVTRPEGALLWLAILPVLWRERLRWRSFAPAFAMLLLALCVVLVSRLAYFHDLVPQPFYFKLAARSDWSAVHQFLWHSGLYIAGVFALPLLFVRRAGHLALVFTSLAVTAGWGAFNVETKPYFRHLAPALPFVYLLSAAGLETLTAQLRRGEAVRVVVVAAFVLCLASKDTTWFRAGRIQRNPIRVAAEGVARQPLATSAALLNKLAAPLAANPHGDSLGVDRNRKLGSNHQALVGRFLANNYGPGTTIVYDQKGQTPFYAGPDKTFLDSDGLTDRMVGAHLFDRRTAKGSLLAAYASFAAAVDGVLGFDSSDSSDSPRRPSLAEVRRYLWLAEPDLLLVNYFAHGGFDLIVAKDPVFTRQYERRYWIGPEYFPKLVLVYARRGSPRPALSAPPGLVLERSPGTP